MKNLFRSRMMCWKAIALSMAWVVFLFTVPSALADAPTPMAAKKAATQALLNVRQMGLMLFEFDADYGSFPLESTVEAVENASGKKLPAVDKTSNAMFRQFFAADITTNEELFFANIPGVIKGADHIEAAHALGKGKNAFSYIAGLGAAVPPATPVVVCPLIHGSTKFDPKPFGGKAVILRADCSALLLPIEEDGRVLVEGVELLSKEHPVWKGKAPDIRYPDFPKE